MKLKVAETMDVEEIPQKLAEMMEQIKTSVVNELTFVRTCRISYRGRRGARRRPGRRSCTCALDEKQPV